MKFEVSALPQSVATNSPLHGHRYNYCPVFLVDPISKVPAQKDELVTHIEDLCDCV